MSDAKYVRCRIKFQCADIDGVVYVRVFDIKRMLRQLAKKMPLNMADVARGLLEISAQIPER